MSGAKQSNPKPEKLRHRLLGAAGMAFVALTTLPSAWAQYSYDPRNQDEQGPGIKYFGSVKDDRGALLNGAVVMIQHEYMLVSDDQGRFRSNLPANLPGEKVAVTCSHPGYQPIRIIKRLGPHGPKEIVEVDCVMHATK
jgi:hypothetical protein